VGVVISCDNCSGAIVFVPEVPIAYSMLQCRSYIKINCNMGRAGSTIEARKARA